MAEFASRGVAGSGLGLGIAGTALGLLNNGGNGGGVLGKVNELALTTQAKFGCLDQTIAGMMGTMNNITKTIVPASAICPAPMPCITLGLLLRTPLLLAVNG